MGLLLVLGGVILPLIIIITIGIAIARMNNDTTTPRTTPKDFFLYLAAAITLYISAGSLLALLFHIIDTALPDALNPSYGGIYAGGIRFAIASLVIIFPLYLFLSWFIRKGIVANAEKAHIAIRKWFIYFTLFIAGAAMVGDLIALINTFLGGEITSRFILKVLAMLVVAGTVFWYYLYDLRRTDRGDMRVRTSFVWIAALCVLAAIVGGFVVAGSPMTARSLRFDQERVMHLQNIQWEVVNYWQSKGKIPSALSDLEDSITGFRAPSDPQTGASYTYTVTGARAFTLCATFSLASSPEETRAYPKYAPEFGMEENWAHEAGEHCFDRTIDPDRFPPLPKD